MMMNKKIMKMTNKKIMKMMNKKIMKMTNKKTTKMVTKTTNTVNTKTTKIYLLIYFNLYYFTINNCETYECMYAFTMTIRSYERT